MKVLILLALIISPINCLAKETVLIKRRGTKRKALLERKFVYVQEAPQAFRSESSITNQKTNSPRQIRTSKNLNTLSKSLKKIPHYPFPNPQSQKVNPQSLQSKSVEKPENLYDEENWNDYAIETEVELDESLSVKAKIR